MTMIELELNAQADDQKLLAQVIDFYQRTVKESPEALDFLRKRGISNPTASNNSASATQSDAGLETAHQRQEGGA